MKMVFSFLKLFCVSAISQNELLKTEIWEFGVAEEIRVNAENEEMVSINDVEIIALYKVCFLLLYQLLLFATEFESISIFWLFILRVLIFGQDDLLNIDNGEFGENEDLLEQIDGDIPANAVEASKV